MATEISEDPCGSFGADQRWAVVWFLSVIVVGSCLTYTLSRIDRYNFDTKGVYLDYDKYRENRVSSTSIGSERSDSRATSLLATKVGSEK